MGSWVKKAAAENISTRKLALKPKKREKISRPNLVFYNRVEVRSAINGVAGVKA